MNKNLIYLDNASTTKPYPDVIQRINYVNHNVYANPSSLHSFGLEAERVVEQARETIAHSLKVESAEIFFTSGGTESNNLCILGYIQANPRAGKHIITSTIEHPSILEVFKALESRGYVVDYVDVDKCGIVNIASLESKIRPDTALLSIMHINNEVGSIQPIEKIVQLKNSINKSAVIHVDAIQSYGKTPIDPRALGIDLMSISSHKIHGPKGTGAVYMRKGLKVTPIILGGGQERSIRSGTQNVPGISGFGVASQLAHKNMQKNWTHVLNLKQLFLKGLYPASGTFYEISTCNSLPYILNVSFPGIQSEVLLHHLEQKNIFISSGSACSSRKNTYSHVLKAMGIPSKTIQGAIRISFSQMNTEEEISVASKHFIEFAQTLLNF